MPIFRSKEKPAVAADVPDIGQPVIDDNARWAQKFNQHRPVEVSTNPLDRVSATPPKPRLVPSSPAPEKSNDEVLAEIEQHKQDVLAMKALRDTLEGDTPDDVVERIYRAHQLATRSRGGFGN